MALPLVLHSASAPVNVEFRVPRPGHESQPCEGGVSAPGPALTCQGWDFKAPSTQQVGVKVRLELSLVVGAPFGFVPGTTLWGGGKHSEGCLLGILLCSLWSVRLVLRLLLAV